MKILYIDHEVAPGSGWGYGLGGYKPVYVGLSNLIERERLWTFAYRWEHEDRTKFVAEWQFSGDRADQQYALAMKLHALYDEADMVVHFNGKHFDDDWSRRIWAENGILPPSPWFALDLYQETKRMKFQSHKMQEITSVLLHGDTKVVTEGMIRMYMRYLAGDKQVKGEVRRYNIQDVDLLIDLLALLRPWIKLPSAPLYDDTQQFDLDGTERPVCPRPGCPDPTHVQSRGERVLATGVYKQWQCQSCGGWLKTNRRSRGTRYVGVQV